MAAEHRATAHPQRMDVPSGCRLGRSVAVAVRNGLRRPPAAWKLVRRQIEAEMVCNRQPQVRNSMRRPFKGDVFVTNTTVPAASKQPNILRHYCLGDRSLLRELR